MDEVSEHIVSKHKRKTREVCALKKRTDFFMKKAGDFQMLEKRVCILIDAPTTDPYNREIARCYRHMTF